MILPLGTFPRLSPVSLPRMCPTFDLRRNGTRQADTNASEVPVEMIVNSSVLCAACFDLREVIPLQLEAAARGGQSQIHGMGTRRYVLSVDNDNEFRSRCE